MPEYIWKDKLEIGTLEESRVANLIVIIGAGLSGLGAAKAITQSGGSVLMLEKSAVPGGRVKSAYFNGTPVSLGAAWLEEHGPIRDALMSLENSEHVTLISPDHLAEVFTVNGKIVPRQEVLKLNTEYSKMVAFFERQKGLYFDRTIYSLLKDYSDYLREHTTQECADVNEYLSLLEVFVKWINQHSNGQSITETKCSGLLNSDGSAVCSADSETGNGYESLMFIKGDIAFLIDYFLRELILTNRFKLLLGREVQQVDAKSGVVHYISSNGLVQSIVATRVINTVPVPILQIREHECFIEGLPVDQVQALKKIPTGIARKVIFSIKPGVSNDDLHIPQVYKNNIHTEDGLIEVLIINTVYLILLTGNDSKLINSLSIENIKDFIAELFGLIPGVNKQIIRESIDQVWLNDQVDGCWPVTPNIVTKPILNLLSRPSGRHIFAQDYLAKTNSMTGAYEHGYEQGLSLVEEVTICASPGK